MNLKFIFLSAVGSTCLLVKLLLIGMLILLDTIMFTIYIIMKTRMDRSEVQGLSVSQTPPPQGLQTAMEPEPDSLSTHSATL